jgi:hypothetical protein
MTLPTLNVSMIPAADGNQRISDPLGEYMPAPEPGTVYYVDPVRGNDAGGWQVNGSETNAAKNLQYVIDQGVLGPGVTINLMAGTYWEAPKPSIYLAPACFHLKTTDGGEEGNLCTIQAAPGHEGRVIFDGQGPDGSYSYKQIGIYASAISYLRMKGLIFIRFSGVAVTWRTCSSGTDPRLGASIIPAVGNEFIDCVFVDLVEGVSPILKDGNPSAIRNDGNIGMLVQNCFAWNVYTVGQNQRGLLVQGFTIADLRCTQCTGWSLNHIGWPKQNSVSLDGEVWQIMEIDHCYVEDSYFGLTQGVMQNNYCANGHQQFHHNIVVGALSGKSNAHGLTLLQNSRATRWPEYDRDKIAGRTDHYHNATLIGGNGTYNSYFASGTEFHTVGNITWGGKGTMQIPYDKVNALEGLHESDYNVYGTPRNFEASVAGVYGTWVRYNSLSAWQAAQPGDSVHFSNMQAGQFDPNSVESNDKTECFMDWENRDFRLPENAPLIGMMPDGSNPGPYQYGNDTQIGCRIPWIDLTQFDQDIPDWLNPGKGTLPLLPSQIPQG